MNDLVIVHIQDVSHPFSIAAWSIAPFVGLYSMNSSDDRDRIDCQFEESVEIPFPVPGFLIHLILDLLELCFCFYFQSVNLHSSSPFAELLHELAVFHWRSTESEGLFPFD